MEPTPPPARNRTALVAGATGLVGREILRGLLADDSVASVHALARRPLGFEHAKLTTHVVDFAKPFLGTLADFNGKDYAGVLGVLDGSSGGTWIDLSPAAATAGASIQYVRFSLPQNEPAGNFFFVDSVTAVPEPGTVAGCALAAAALLRRRQK